MPQGFNYREVLYKDYYTNQSGRTFEHRLKEKMIFEQEHLSREILPLLPPRKDLCLLDIGCGFGSLIYTLKQAGYTHVKGIDLSEGQVKQAHALGLKEVEQAELVSFLKNHPASFDVITGLDIIEHFGKDELIEVLQLIKTSLVKGGMAIFRTPNMDAPFASLYANGDFTHENFLNASSAKQLFLSLGFEQIEIHSSLIKVNGFFKEQFRKIAWFKLKIWIKLVLFATGRSAKGSVLSPNLIIRAVSL